MEKKRLIATLEGKLYTTTDLFECMARHGGRVEVVRLDGGAGKLEGASLVLVGEVIEHSHGRIFYTNTSYSISVSTQRLGRASTSTSPCNAEYMSSLQKGRGVCPATAPEHISAFGTADRMKHRAGLLLLTPF